MSVLLPRFLAHQAAVTTVLDGRREKQDATPRESWDGRAGQGQHADPIRLRGIPVVGGCSGTSPGTDPYLQTERRWGAS